MTAKKKKAFEEELLEDLLDLIDDDSSSSGQSDQPHKKTPAEFEAEVSHLFDAVAHTLDEPVEDEEEEQVEDIDEGSKTEIEIANFNINSDSSSDFEFEKDSPSPQSGDEFDNTLKLDDPELSATEPAPKTSSHDKTVVAGQTQKAAEESLLKSKSSTHEIDADDKVRASVGRFASMQSNALHSPVSAALAQSENLRLAQSRILELENELERIRQDNEKLAAVSETFRKRSDTLSAKIEQLEDKNGREKEFFEHERDLMSQGMEARLKEIEGLNLKIDELETRLSSNIQKIRVRERELENRLELLKMESQALLRNKDEIILDLKRQVDQSSHELDNYRLKGQDLNKQLADKQDMLRRTVKALRIALSMLESEEGEIDFKKAK